ncbi:dTDP-4-dehydrorhamnose 35-epimerase related protein [Candidatus Sulfobium mesophilum]|uniref:dTDP-4-dehydrorhamnose 3,5-epimerase n=1 Tax=Candidatus Sulfobium mesophilum TaxID=2016548 RepID=A0A2U3QJ27_9BACT|nr:dTDP-4-dehydrorhamnose 35-epimerase related protein [Candidatus Sulfobium mesophilum]
MEGVVIKELNVFTDERGWLTELFRNDETDFRPVMSYVSLTKPGISRGPHEHVDQSDFFCFLGNFRLCLWDNRKGSVSFGEKFVLDTGGKPVTAIVPPGVVHAYKNMGPAEGLVLNLPDRLFRGQGKKDPVDEVRYENDPDSPFRI